MLCINTKGLSLTTVTVDDGTPLRQVNSVRLLGVTLSSDLKWDVHVNLAIKKASKRIFVLRNLRKSNCPSALIYKAYTSLVRSVLLYAFPSFCNLPYRLFARLVRLERRCFRIIGNSNFTTISTAGNSMCTNLFRQIEQCSDHPLRELFDCRATRITRNHRQLRPPRARSTRLSNSFIRFSI